MILYFSMFCLGDFLPPSHIRCWRKFVLACRRLVNFHFINGYHYCLLLKFCKGSTGLYGKSAITPNMHMHCHLSSCLQEFEPIHSFWLFPFKCYNGIMEEQRSNNRSIEMQLMSLFQNDNLHPHLQEEVKQWPDANLFLDAFPNPSYNISFPIQFDKSFSSGPKSRIDSFSCELFKNCLINVYCVNYTQYMITYLEKYSTIKWHGKMLTSTLKKNVKNCFVFFFFLSLLLLLSLLRLESEKC